MQLAQVGCTAATGRSAEREKMHVRPIGDFGVISGEPQPPRGGVALQQRLQADLEDMRLSSIQCLDAIGINVDPDNLMAELSQASRMGRTEIVRADDAYPQCHLQILP